MGLSLSQQLGLRPVITAHLAQTMSMLELPTLELEALVTAELASNPALELVAHGRCLNCGRRLKNSRCAICDTVVPTNGTLVHVVDHPSVSCGERHDDVEPCAPETLAGYILRQIAVALNGTDRPIAVYLLAQLDDRGFMLGSLSEIADDLQQPIERVSAILRLIQRADPPGVGASTVQESLLLQLESLADEGCGHALACTLIANYWEMLKLGQSKQVARELHVAQRTVESALEFARRNLTPYPAQAYWGSRHGQSSASRFAFQRPDAIIYRPRNGEDGPLTVEVISPTAGWLQVNATFKAALAECSGHERERWQPSVERAQLIARCVQQRTQTMCRLLEVIAREQRQFILGRQGDLKPLTRADLAEQLGLHESTVSRAVADKSVALPGGRIVPLAQFFDQSLAARQALKSVIAVEQHPLSDDEIAQRLSDQGFPVARRTVTKYRAIEGISSAVERARTKRTHK